MRRSNIDSSTLRVFIDLICVNYQVWTCPQGPYGLGKETDTFTTALRHSRIKKYNKCSYKSSGTTSHSFINLDLAGCKRCN